MMTRITNASGVTSIAAGGAGPPAVSRSERRERRASAGQRARWDAGLWRGLEDYSGSVTNAPRCSRVLEVDE
jgi:hypothetical protein